MLAPWLAIAALAGASLLTGWLALRAFRRRHPGRGTLHAAFAALMLALAALTATAVWSLTQYRALSRETTAAVVQLEPTGFQRFRALVTFPDGEARSYELTGDQLWVDARIVKWHPWANVLGLHTAYRLERIGGRYRSLDDEQLQPRVVRSLRQHERPDPLAWAARRPWLAPLIDAEYGSGTWSDAEMPAELEVRVSTSGLLLRSR